MEKLVDCDFPSSSLILNIKKEPKNESDDDDSFESGEPEYNLAKSLVLRFIRGKNGYSVVPLIKPDPFFEEYLDDVNAELTPCNVKSEEDEPAADADTVQNLNIKQRTIDTEGKSLVEVAESGKQVQNHKTKSVRLTRCPNCSYSGTRKFVRRHIQRVHSFIKHPCSFCGKDNFKEPFAVDCHVLRNHADVEGAIDHIRRTIFECTFCCYKTLKRCNLSRHLITHGESRLRTQLETKWVVDGPQSKHDLKKALSRAKYDCLHCPYTTKDKGSIIKHLRLHRENRLLPHCCKACNKHFNEKTSLDAHIVKRNTDDTELLESVTSRVYECELCDYKDVNKNKVIRHKRARHVNKEKKLKKLRRRGKVKQ